MIRTDYEHNKTGYVWQPHPRYTNRYLERIDSLIHCTRFVESKLAGKVRETLVLGDCRPYTVNIRGNLFL